MCLTPCDFARLWERKANICPILILAVARLKEGMAGDMANEGEEVEEEEDGRECRSSEKRGYFSFAI